MPKPCPIGIDGLKVVAKKVDISNAVEAYEKCINKLNAAPKSKPNSDKKIINIINALKSLAEIDIKAGEGGFDCALDVMAECNKLYSFISKNFTQADIEMLDKTKDNSLLKEAVSPLYSPVMLKNVAHALYAASERDPKSNISTDDKKTFTKDQLSDDEDATLRLNTKLEELYDLKREKSSFIPRNVTSSRKTNSSRMFHNANENNESNVTINNNLSNITPLNSQENENERNFEIFVNSENMINLAISLLKDPALRKLKNEKDKKDLQQYLYECISFHMGIMQNAIKASPLVQAKIIEQQNIYELVHAATSSIKFPEISEKFYTDSTCETQHIKLPSCEVEELGKGEFHVFKLTNTATGAAIVVRAQLMTPEDLTAKSSPANLRLRVANSLDDQKSSLTMQYEFVPGVSEVMPYYRNYEISQAISGGNLLERFQKLHAVLKPNALNYQENKQLLQANFIYFMKEIIELMLALKKAGLCYTDLKPTNMLVQNGLIKISDMKSLIDISNLKPNESYKINSDQSLPLTNGFYTNNSVKIEDHQQIIDTDKLIAEALCFTAYQLLTPNVSADDLTNVKVPFANVETLLNSTNINDNANAGTTSHFLPFEDELEEKIKTEDELGETVKTLYKDLLDLAKSQKTLKEIYESLCEKVKIIEEKIKIDLHMLISPEAYTRNRANALYSEVPPTPLPTARSHGLRGG